MKQYIIIILLILGVKNTNSQCWNTANPYSNTWIWQTQGANYPVYYLHGMNQSQGINLELPYFFTTTQNNLNPNYVRFWNQDLDIKPEDGWVLISKSFGTYNNGSINGSGTVSPHFVLYNKFTGKMRIMYGLSGTLPGQTTSIKTEFEKNYSRTALFAFTEPVAKTIQYFSKSNSSNTLNKHQFNTNTGNGTFWYYSDFMTAYDPCACLINPIDNSGKSSAVVISQTTYNTSTLTATINGTIEQDMEVSSSGVGNGSTGLTLGKVIKAGFTSYETFNGYKSKFNSFVDGFHKDYKDKVINDYWKDAIKKDPSSSTWNSFKREQEYKNFISSKDGMEKISGLKNLDKYQSAVGTIKGIASLVPYVGTAIGIFESLFGGNGGSTPPTPMNFYVNLRLNGTLDNEQYPAKLGIKNPGTKVSIPSSLDPVYDNTLGVLNMLYPPTFEYVEINPVGLDAPTIEDGLTCCDIQAQTSGGYVDNVIKKNKMYQYRVKKLPRIVVNPHSELEIEAVDAAIVFDYQRVDRMHLIDSSQNEDFALQPFYKSGNNSLYNYKTAITYQTMKKIPYYPLVFKTNQIGTIISNIEEQKEMELEYINKEYDTGYSTGILRFRTPYVPLQCINNLNFTLMGGGETPNTYIKVLIKLKHKTNPNRTYTQLLTFDASNTMKDASLITSVSGSYKPQVYGTNCWATSVGGSYIPPTPCVCISKGCNDMNYNDFLEVVKPFTNPLKNVLDGSINSIILPILSPLGTNITPNPVYINGSANITQSINGYTVYATGKIVINSNVQLANCNLFANTIENNGIQNPSSVYTSKDVSIIDFIGCNSPVSNVIATTNEIAAVCNSSTYRDSAGLKSAIRKDPFQKNISTLSLSLHPNPSSTSTTLTLTNYDNTSASIKIYDMIGREVSSQLEKEIKNAKHEVLLNTQELHSGIYIVKVNNGVEEKSLKLEIQK